MVEITFILLVWQSCLLVAETVRAVRRRLAAWAAQDKEKQ
jgi:hypothetical protein